MSFSYEFKRNHLLVDVWTLLAVSMIIQMIITISRAVLINKLQVNLLLLLLLLKLNEYEWKLKLIWCFLQDCYGHDTNNSEPTQSTRPFSRISSVLSFQIDDHDDIHSETISETRDIGDWALHDNSSSSVRFSIDSPTESSLIHSAVYLVSPLSKD